MSAHVESIRLKCSAASRDVYRVDLNCSVFLYNEHALITIIKVDIINHLTEYSHNVSMTTFTANSMLMKTMKCGLKFRRNQSYNKLV